MGGDEEDSRFFKSGIRAEDDQTFFSSLYEQIDECPECGSGPLVLRSRGYMCPNRACKLLVIPYE